MEPIVPERCLKFGCKKLCMEHLSLFCEMPPELETRIASNAVASSHLKGSHLFHEGDTIDRIRIIRKGQVKLCRFDAEGREFVHDVLSDGNSIWEGIFRENATFIYDGICLTDVELCEVSRKFFLEEIAGKPEIASYLIELLSKRLAESKERAALLSIRDPKVRMAGFLLDRDKRWRGQEINLKLEEIAASVGLREETVSRVLRSFEKEGTIERLGKGKIRLRDRKRLDDLMSGLI